MNHGPVDCIVRIQSVVGRIKVTRREGTKKQALHFTIKQAMKTWGRLTDLQKWLANVKEKFPMLRNSSGSIYISTVNLLQICRVDLIPTL